MILMLKEKLKTNNNSMKKNAVYVFLTISNIILYIGFISYYSKVGINVDIGVVEDILAAIGCLFILGYISIRIPKIKNLGESSFYNIFSFAMVILIGLMTSYFGGTLDIASRFGPYLEMFKILCGVLVFILIALRLKSFREVISGNFTRKNLLVCMIIFVLVGLFASYVHQTINDTPANIRCLIVMIGGLFGGPAVGIPTGIISGAYRYTLGGMTAVPCAISTVFSGIIGSLIFIWNDKKFPGIIESMVLAFLFTGFEMLIVVILTPANVSYPFVLDIYPVMAFAAVIGMLLFSITFREAESKINPQLSYEEEKFKEYDEKIEALENEIEKLKRDK